MDVIKISPVCHNCKSYVIKLPCPHCGGKKDANKPGVGRVQRLIAQRESSGPVGKLIKERKRLFEENLDQDHDKDLGIPKGIVKEQLKKKEKNISKVQKLIEDREKN